jgi:hypothetical protein
MWRSWRRAGMPHNGGNDQLIMREFAERPIEILQRLYPGIVSFKYHKLQDGPRPGDRIVNFHNRPKNDDFPSDHWVSKVWNQKE